MSNIKVELASKKTKASIVFLEDDAVKQVKLLESSEAMEDLRIANALGKKHNIARAQDTIGKKLQIEKLDGKFAGNVYTLNDIKSLARKYNMRFLQSKHYCGSLDIEVISKLKQFSKETKTEITDGNLHDNFYILAPEKCFNLEKVKKMRRDPDPAIFYNIDGYHFRLIHQWGSDFSILNRIAGWNWASRSSKFKLQITISVIFCAILAFVLDRTDMFGKWDIVVVAVITILSIIRANIVSFNNGFNFDERFHAEKWRSTTQYD